MNVELLANTPQLFNKFRVHQAYDYIAIMVCWCLKVGGKQWPAAANCLDPSRFYRHPTLFTKFLRSKSQKQLMMKLDISYQEKN